MANLLKPNIWLNTINLDSTSFMYDPWYFEIPLAFKPTYLYMEIYLHFVRLFDIPVDVH